MSFMEGVQHLKIPLEEIKVATNNFSDENFLAQGGFGQVYLGKLTLSGQQSTVAVKRLDRKFGQGDREFLMEIQMLSSCTHKNLISLVGFCDEGGENLLVYEHAKNGSLDNYLSDYSRLSWMQRLQISLGAARALNYLHNDVGTEHRILHRDIKSSNILLTENWEARISDFGLSKIGPSNTEFTFLVTSACGTFGYVDPEYVRTGILTKESDVYSFGVVLFEILCGRLALADYQDERRFLSSLARSYFEQNKLSEIIHPDLMNQIKVDSLYLFSKVAYQCLSENRSERPTMGSIVEELENAMELQVCSKAFSKVAGVIMVGTWERPSEVPQNQYWSFKLEKDHKLVKINIDHGDVIHALMFTSESRGVLHASDKSGGLAGGDTVSEVTFDSDEQIIGINGTIGTRDGYSLISSLSFETNKRTHGPFGRATELFFSIPWEEGSLTGFCGNSRGNYIDDIGMYIKPFHEIVKVGTWRFNNHATEQKRSLLQITANLFFFWCWPYQNRTLKTRWSFQLKKYRRLKKITIEHGEHIYSLMFTSQYRDKIKDSRGARGRLYGETVSKVIFDRNEELIGISGTLELKPGGFTKTTSMSFKTNRKTHGPFGFIRGESFSQTWDDGSFAGFYGIFGDVIDSIGVYLKPVV